MRKYADVPAGSRSTSEHSRTFVDQQPAVGGATTRRGFLAATGSAAALSVTGCLGDSGPDEVSFGTIPIAAVAEVFLAEERGYFEDRNIELDMERIEGFGEVVPRLASGDLDVATGSISAGLINAIAGGQPVQVVADQTQYWENQPSANRFWVAEEYYTEGMTIDDLPQEFTYAVNAQGSSIDYLLGKLLQQTDVTFDDVDIVQMPFPQMVSAMAQGDLDVCSIPDPLGLQLPREANAGQLLYGSQLAPRMQIGVYIYGEPFMQERPDVAQRWLEAYLLGVREYYDMGGYQNEEVAGIISDTIEVPVPAIRSSVPSLPQKNGRVNKASLMEMQDYLECRGFLEETVEESEIVNEEFLDGALEEVGELDASAATPSVSTIDEWRENAPNPWPPVGEMLPPKTFPTNSLCE